MHLATLLLLILAIGCGNKSSESDSGTDNAGDPSGDDDHNDHDDHGDTDIPDDFDNTRELLSNNGLFYAVYEPLTDPIPESTEFSVLVTLYDPTDQTTVLTEAIVSNIDSTMPTHGGHGMNVNPVVTDNGDGTWTGSPLKYHMPGYWVLHVEATLGSESDRADFEISCCE